MMKNTHKVWILVATVAFYVSVIIFGCLFANYGDKIIASDENEFAVKFQGRIAKGSDAKLEQPLTLRYVRREITFETNPATLSFYFREGFVFRVKVYFGSFPAHSPNNHAISTITIEEYRDSKEPIRCTVTVFRSALIENIMPQRLVSSRSQFENLNIDLNYQQTDLLNSTDEQTETDSYNSDKNYIRKNVRNYPCLTDTYSTAFKLIVDELEIEMFRDIEVHRYSFSSS